jgi:hypothetical protein
MSENITEVVETNTVTEEDEKNQTPQTPTLVSTRIPELSNILLIGSEEFYINAKRAEEASKVSESLLINCVGPKNVTQIGYNGEKQKSISVVPATGGTFVGPIFAESGINVADKIRETTVVTVKDFETLYNRYKNSTNTINSKAFNILEMDISETEQAFKLDSVTDLEINDLFSVCLVQNNINQVFVDIGKITEINTEENTIKFSFNNADSNIPEKIFDQLKNSSLREENGWPVTGSMVNSLWVSQKPNCGTKVYISFFHTEGAENTVIGSYSHAEGWGTYAGYLSHSEGNQTQALNESHAEGYKTYAYGENSHAEGNTTKAMGQNSHAEGTSTVTIGESSHAEGEETAVTGKGAHSEGFSTKAGGKAFKILEAYKEAGKTGVYRLDSAEGLESGMTYSVILKSSAYDIGKITDILNQPNENGSYAHYVTVDNYQDISLNTAEDSGIFKYNLFLIADRPDLGTIEIGSASHAEGVESIASNLGSHAEGRATKAVGKYSHTEGQYTIAGHAAHAEGSRTKALGDASHAEGEATEASGKYSHSEGINTKAEGAHSHSEGKETTASGSASHAEGENTTASKKCAHSEGNTTTASGECAHSEGKGTTASGSCSHAEGQNTQANGQGSHTEGFGDIGGIVTATGYGAHAEGVRTTAEGDGSHVEGHTNKALGVGAHAEGQRCIANKQSAHAEGYNTKASSNYQHTQGKFNIEDTKNKYAHIVGNGTSETNRQNAHTIDWNGNAWFAGNAYVGGTGQNTGKKLATEDFVTSMFYTGANAPNNAPIGSIWIKTKS